MIIGAFKELAFRSKLLSRQLNKALNTQKPIRISNKYFFVHIPKTAGTSFRRAIEANHKVIADYGSDAHETSLLIRYYTYEKEDFFELKEILDNEGEIWLCGHVPLNRFVNFFPIQNTITFVREPLSQVVSHYNHYVSYYNYTDSIEKFINHPGLMNLQYRRLNCLPISLIGYIGLTEKYDESLEIINHHLGLDIKSITANVNKTKTLILDSVTDAQKKLILARNNLDVELYEEANFLHQERVKLASNDKSWVYGHINLNAKKVLNGCAFYSDNDKAVNLVVVKNGEELLKASAKGFYNGQPKVNFPRGRYIGFNIALAKEINKDDIIDVYVEETGQKLNFKPLKVF